MLRVAVARVDPASDAEDDAAPGWMDDAERARRAGLAPTARRAFTASRGLLRELRRVTGGLPGDEALYASLSHRLDWVAAAVSDAPVGVDIERERPPRSAAAERAALMLSPAELAAWSALGAATRELDLLTRWTAKEAWYKASPADAAPWDFRRIVAQACPAGDANVRTWTAPPVHLALCSADARALAAVECDGWDAATTSFWHVRRVACAD